MAPLYPHLGTKQPCKQRYDARRLAAQLLVQGIEAGRVRAVRLRAGKKPGLDPLGR